MTYKFRQRFHIEPSYKLSSGIGSRLSIAEGVLLEPAYGGDIENTHQFVLVGRGYGTADQAWDAGMRWSDALLLNGLHESRGLDLGLFRNRGTVLSALGHKVFEEHLGRSIRVDVHGLDVFEEGDASPNFIDLAVTALVTGSAERFVARLSGFAQGPTLPDELRMALHHFGLSRFAREPRDAFLGLITAIETLAKPETQSQDRCELVDRFLELLPDGDRNDASFVGRIQDLKRVSISQACQRLVRNALGADHVAAFKRLYNVRSKLSHTGTANTDFIAERTEAEKLVIALLLHSTRGQR